MDRFDTGLVNVGGDGNLFAESHTSQASPNRHFAAQVSALISRDERSILSTRKLYGSAVWFVVLS